MSDDEMWRPIPGFEGRYEVSNLGGLRSLCSGSPRELRPSRTGGRRMVRLRVNGVSRSFRVYTMVLEAFVGPRPPGMFACHNDGNPSNDRLDNLRWDTPTSNNLDMVRHGVHGMARRDSCRRGHPFVEWNLVPHLLRYRNERACLACQRAKGNRRFALRCGRDIDVQAAADAHFARLEAQQIPLPAGGGTAPCMCPGGAT